MTGLPLVRRKWKLIVLHVKSSKRFLVEIFLQIVLINFFSKWIHCDVGCFIDVLICISEMRNFGRKWVKSLSEIPVNAWGVTAYGIQFNHFTLWGFCKSNFSEPLVKVVIRLNPAGKQGRLPIAWSLKLSWHVGRVSVERIAKCEWHGNIRAWAGVKAVEIIWDVVMPWRKNGWMWLKAFPVERWRWRRVFASMSGPDSGKVIRKCPLSIKNSNSLALKMIAMFSKKIWLYIYIYINK